MTDRVDTAEIAAMLKLERETVTDKIVKRPDFPAPSINRSRRLRRWDRKDVEAWMAGKDYSREAMSSEEAL
jgi:predicted DNA-binding transcriptional regulator AlpA